MTAKGHNQIARVRISNNKKCNKRSCLNVRDGASSSGLVRGGCGVPSARAAELGPGVGER
eukprot:2054753-Rhodomonas_salina.2